MTEKQQKVLMRAYIELEKHFKHSVIIVCEEEIPGSIVQPDPYLSWSGGYIAAKHLIQDAKKKIVRRKLTRSVPSVNKEIIEEFNEKTK